MTRRPSLAVTMGDPAGVGGEITLKAWLRRNEGIPAFFVIDDAQRLIEIAKTLNWDAPVQIIQSPEDAQACFQSAVPVLHQPLPAPVTPGTPSAQNADAILKSIRTAVELTQSGHAAGVVTNPIAKDVLYAAGFKYPGHTEYLAHLGGDVSPVMMLACEHLRVVLATVHVSLQEAINTLNTETICKVARITHDALQKYFSIAQPTIAIAGLNPHAGEGGGMGQEEIDIIVPAIERLNREGVRAVGPFPPDTMFTARARPTYDVALCMYHDQGLIPLKTLDFDRGVNATLGLPFVRTSPDHGTAFDIAGTGKASEDSLIAALNMALKMTTARSQS